MTVKEAQRRINSDEFGWWMAYDRIEPFGEERADLRIAQLCALIANINRSKKCKIYKVKDFMFDFEGKADTVADRRQPPEEMISIFTSFAAAHNAFLKSRKGGA